MAGGDSYGASLSSSDSKASAASGTTDSSSAQYNFATPYGPGSYIAAMAGTPATGSGGASASVSTGTIVAGIIAVLVFVFFLKRR